MFVNQHKGLFCNNGLSTSELNEIKALAEKCNTYDGIDLKLNWDMLETRSTDEMNDLLFYQDGVLVGFLGLYQIIKTEMEVSGMVDPEYRRKGIFRSMVDVAKEEAKKRGIPKLIMICDHLSQSGIKALEYMGGKYSFSEHKMKYESSVRIPTNKTLSILPVNPDLHKEVLIRLDMASFGMAKEVVEEYVTRELQDPIREIYIASLEDEIIGKILVDRAEGSAFFYAFTVFPEHRGKGYGREILSRMVEQMLDEGRSLLQLEVATENSRALRLYESCGFRVTSRYDYYDLVVE